MMHRRTPKIVLLVLVAGLLAMASILVVLLSEPGTDSSPSPAVESAQPILEKAPARGTSHERPRRLAASGQPDPTPPHAAPDEEAGPGQGRGHAHGEADPEDLPRPHDVGNLLRGPLGRLIDALELPQDVEARVRTPEGLAILDQERHLALQRMDSLFRASGRRAQEIVAQHVRDGRPLPPRRRGEPGYSEFWHSQLGAGSLSHEEFPELGFFRVSMRRLPGDLRATILRRFPPETQRSR